MLNVAVKPNISILGVLGTVFFCLEKKYLEHMLGHLFHETSLRFGLVPLLTLCFSRHS